MTRTTILLSLALGALTAAGLPAAAQSGRFSPAIIVNDSVITQYELEQRIRFLTILRAPVDPAVEAQKGLIEDRLRMQTAKQAGLVVTDAQIQSGMTEFAGRANMDAEQFIQAIGQEGVAAETFRDFVTAGIAWRQLVRGRFGPSVKISDAEVDRAMTVEAQRGAGPRVLLAEIILPTSPANFANVNMTATELSQNIGSAAEFAAAARQYSAAPSRVNGGEIGWIPFTNLPPQARQVVGSLANGQISPPVPMDGAIALFRLRGIEQGGEINPANITVDYAQVLIPGGRSAAALASAEKIRSEVDTCDDLYRAVTGQPDRILRETRPIGQVPGDIAAELARLDQNESSTALTRGDALVFLMLCQRSATIAAGGLPAVDSAAAAGGDGAPAIDPKLGFGQGPNREQLREELTNQRIGALAEGWLAELKANATIELR